MTGISVKKELNPFIFLTAICLAASRSTLGHSQGDSLTNPMLITAFELFRHEGHGDPCMLKNVQTCFRNLAV